MTQPVTWPLNSGDPPATRCDFAYPINSVVIVNSTVWHVPLITDSNDCSRHIMLSPIMYIATGHMCRVTSDETELSLCTSGIPGYEEDYKNIN